MIPSLAPNVSQECQVRSLDGMSTEDVLPEPSSTVIVEYLAKSFPKVGGNVNVNRATAKELADELKLTAEEADAMVRYREENGYFNKFQDLQKVTGLDIKKLESAKDRLAY